MTLDLAALRAMRKNSVTSLAAIAQKLQAEDSGGKKEDERLWKATVDKAGNGSAVIRFLPAINDGELPWVKVYDKGFQGPNGKWYIEKCLTTIGKSDPVVEYCNTLWTGSEDDKEKARKMKRRLSFYANVLIVKDPAAPENEGQVKIFKFGKKIYDKLADALQPQFEDIDPVLFFDPFVGANFRLRIRKVEGYSNTDKSEFDSQSELAGGDEQEMLRILGQRHDLSEFLNPSTFKTYEELQKKFEQVMFAAPSAGMAKAAEFIIGDETPTVKPRVESKSKPEPTPQRVKEVSRKEIEEDDMEFFKNLVEN